MKDNKGCVYFFRHVGLTPVKIGYSENSSPIDRFNCFRTYAPYGSEILGFIQTYDPCKLESLIHEKFCFKKLKGEWFEITQEDVETQINLYSQKEDIENKSRFELAWANKVNKVNSNIDTSNKESFFEYYSHNTKEQKTKIAKKFKVTRATIYSWIKEFEAL